MGIVEDLGLWGQLFSLVLAMNWVDTFGWSYFGHTGPTFSGLSTFLGYILALAEIFLDKVYKNI